MKFYIFKEAYIRLSSEKFSLTRRDLHNKFIHLTNNAIQKTSANYCKFEEGNIWSLTQLKQYLELSQANFTIAQIQN